MFKTGDVVMHHGAGLCKIEAIRSEAFGGGEAKDYYILTAVYDSGQTTIHIPVDKGKLHLRPVLTKQDIEGIIKNIPRAPLWTEQNTKRREIFSKVIQDGDQRELIRLIAELHKKKEEKERAGKKLYVVDEKALCAAEKLIHQEFAHALGIEPDEVPAFIMGELKKQEEKLVSF